MYTATAQSGAGALGPRHVEPPARFEPSGLVGKVLRKIQWSRDHPALTLYFTDNTAYQVRVEDYDPSNRGLPKEIELDAGFKALLQERSDQPELNLTVIAARMTILQDRGWESRDGRPDCNWNQRHASIVLKFKEQPNWHSISVMVAEYGPGGACTFRNFKDVYLDKLSKGGRNRGGKARR